MKKSTLHAFLLFTLIFISSNTWAAFSSDGFQLFETTPVVNLTRPDMKKIQSEDLVNDANHLKYRIGVATQVYITPENSGQWHTLENGDRIWQLEINYPGAEALSFMFDRFIITGSTTFDAFSKDGNKLHETFTVTDVLDHGQQNLELCFGDNMILQLYEPAGVQPSQLLINNIHYNYRATGNPNVAKINESDACQVNVRCTPEGTDYQDEKRGVVRILVVDGQGSGWCSGSVVNNVNQNCKPYVLTALHCGELSTATHFNQYKFYFDYEAPSCTNPTSAGTLASKSINSCFFLAGSNDGGGNSGSDFLLVQMGTVANEAATIAKMKQFNFAAYWNGWDANNTASSSGVSIHHPAGDIKKISTYTSPLTTTSWGTSGTHWRVVWTGTANGHGVTEGGSSGSPIFNYNNGNSRIVGTLTGGSSFCNATGSPDAYGKMSYHWTSNGAPASERLKTFLDPGNTGTMVLNGSQDPCNGGLAVHDLKALNAISVYPNPSTAVMNVDLSSLNSRATISIYDLSGKLLLEVKDQENSMNEINISTLSNGAYHVVISSEEGQIMKKIMKM